jgi:hypothetical protein
MYGDKKLGMQLTIWKLCLCIELEIIRLFVAKATIIQSSDCQNEANHYKDKCHNFLSSDSHLPKSTTTMSKGVKPSTQTKVKPAGAADTGIVSSPSCQQQSKCLFTGEKAMEEDGQSLPSQEELQKKRAQERAAKMALLQKAVEKLQEEKKKKKGSRKQLIDSDDESMVMGGKPKAANANRKGKGRKPRGRSLPPAERKSQAKVSKSRATSVDSSVSKPSKAGSDSSGSSSKCKPSPAPILKASKKTTKSAKFSDGIPDNEGKAASTKKSAKEKKRETYAKKATKGKKKSWIYSTVMEYRTRVGKCSNVTSEMYSCQSSAF